MITQSYKELNSELHKSNPDYGTSGGKYSSQVAALAMSIDTTDILDYGCGKSTLANNLSYKIKQYDPAIPKYSELPAPAELVVCTDVLEHIEPEHLDNVLNHLQELTLKKIFLIIATRPARKTLADGRNAHLIIENAKWWLDKIWERFNIVGFQDFKEQFVVIADKK